MTQGMFQAMVAILVVAMLMPRPDLLRLGVMAAAIVAIIGAIESGGVVDRLLGPALLIAAVIPFGRRLFTRMTVGFSAEEEHFRFNHVPTLDRVAARHLLDQGHWISAKAGDELIREKAAVENFFFLAAGVADVRAEGNKVGECRAGELIGEASALDGGQAMATVTMRETGRLWFISAPALRAYIDMHPDVASALRQGFVNALRTKLKTTNTRVAEKAG